MAVVVVAVTMKLLNVLMRGDAAAPGGLGLDAMNDGSKAGTRPDGWVFRSGYLRAGGSQALRLSRRRSDREPTRRDCRATCRWRSRRDAECKASERLSWGGGLVDRARRPFLEQRVSKIVEAAWP